MIGCGLMPVVGRIPRELRRFLSLPHTLGHPPRQHDSRLLVGVRLEPGRNLLQGRRETLPGDQLLALQFEDQRADG